MTMPRRMLAGSVTTLLAPAVTAAEPLRAGQALEVFGALLLVLALIAAATWGARRLQAFRPQGKGSLRVVEGLAIGTREKLLLIEVDDERVLLGVSPGRIQTLARLSATRAKTPDFEAALTHARTEQPA